MKRSPSECSRPSKNRLATTAPVFTDTLDEIQQHTGQTIDALFDITGAATAYLQTSKILLFLLG